MLRVWANAQSSDFPLFLMNINLIIKFENTSKTIKVEIKSENTRFLVHMKLLGLYIVLLNCERTGGPSCCQRVRFQTPHYYSG